MAATSPNPEQVIGQPIVAPQETAPQETPQETAPETPAPAPAVPAADLRDEILSVEQTGNLLRGLPVDAKVDEQELEQQQLAQDFFAGIPVQETAPQEIPVQAGETPQVVPPVQQPAPAVGAPQPPPPGTPVPVALPVPPAVDPMMAQMQAEMTAMRAQNTQLAAQVAQGAQQQNGQAQPQGQATPGAPGAPGTPPAQTYNFNVPDAHLAALGHEDPNQQRAALNSLLNGVAEAVSQQLRSEQTTALQQVPTQIDTAIQHQAEIQRVQSDMYGTYPELGDHKSYVIATARQMETMYPAGWSADMRDAIAEKLAPLVPGLFEKVQRNKAQRIAGGTVPPPVVPQVALPQQQIPTPAPGMVPGHMVGGQHVAPRAVTPAPAGAPAPVLMRDAAGNIFSQAAPTQPYVGGSQMRQAGVPGVDPQVLDIWNTLDIPY